MSHRLAAVLTALALVAPAAVLAQPVSSISGPATDTWLELHLGAALPQHADLDAVDPGYAFGGAFGARFSPYLGAELGVGYWRATGTEPGLELTASDVPVTANVRIRLPGRVVELSAAAGAGLHVATFSVTPTASLAGPTPPSRTSVAFGGQVSAAAGFHLSPTMLVGASVERTFVEPKFHGAGVRFDTLRLAATLTYHL
jgi:hypothetical protein